LIFVMTGTFSLRGEKGHFVRRWADTPYSCRGEVGREVRSIEIFIRDAKKELKKFRK